MEWNRIELMIGKGGGEVGATKKAKTSKEGRLTSIALLLFSSLLWPADAAACLSLSLSLSRRVLQSGSEDNKGI